METRAKIDFFYDKNEDWESTYNNQNFFKYNLHRMRYLVVDTELKNNPFEGCVDLETLEIKDQLAFDSLSVTPFESLIAISNNNEWRWIGDDFEHMWQYLNFITDHDKTFMYNTRIMGEDEYMHIYGYNIPEQYQKGDLREAYLAGQSDAEKGLS